MTKFKLGLLIVFGLFIVIGMIVFASTKAGEDTPGANLIVWGTLKSGVLSQFLSAIKVGTSNNITISYLEKDPQNFDSELAEAIADSKGPDMIILPHDMIFRHKNKLFEIPYKTFSQRLYKDTFLEESEIFLNPEGIMAMPFIIDPLVMYWNRDIFKNNSLTLPPKYWDEFLTLSQKINKRDSSGNFTQTVVSLGEWRNITHSKEILSNILLQTGTPITRKVGDIIISTLGESNEDITPGNSTVQFYTQFANPTSPSYSWNRSLPSSINYFLSGNLATYIGFASELAGLSEKNPNLNFDVTFVPETRQSKNKVIFGKLYGIAILKKTSNIAQSFSAMNSILSDQNLKSLESITNLPPIKRRLLTDTPENAYKSVFYQSAIFAKGWIDPDRKASDLIFQNMIESITSGKSRVSDALSRADQELSELLRK